MIKWFVCEKLDGISIEVVYENGKFTQAITRGNGEIGEDISSNVKNMKGVPLQLESFTGSLRGEIIMKKSIHKEHFSTKANSRNAASGVSKRLDGVGSKHLDVIFYQALGDVEFTTEVEQFEWLAKNKCEIPNYWIFKDSQEVSAHWRSYQDTSRINLDYDIDGLVIRINDLSKQLSFGDKDMRPKGAIAFKFDNAMAESVIRDVIFQTGNSGRITPVAIVDPVMLVGAKVTKASLYNMANINNLKIDIGATVLVTRNNDVIPSIFKVIKGTGKTLSPPTECPACKFAVTMVGENLQCPNTSTCPGQTTGRIKNWISELNILEVGETLIEKLVESGKVTTIADLYKLSVDDYADIDRMGQKSAKTVHNNLWKDSEVTLDKFLGGLSMTMIGSSTIKLIMDAGCDTLEKFGQLTANEFENVAGVGPIKAKYLEQGLKNNQSLILDLLASGVKIKGKVHGNLTGKKIAITGSTKMKRAELEKLIESHGGENKSSAGKGTTLLIISDVNSTSSKAVAARKLGIELITEDDFLKLI